MSTLVFYILLGELAVISYFDFRYKKIHNLWALLNISLFCFFLFLLPEEYSLNIKTFVFPLAFIFVGYVLYMLNIMGPGDSKYLFSFFLLIPAQFHERVFLLLAYTTVFVGVFMLLSTTVQNFKKILIAVKLKDVGAIRQVFGSKFSYAPVIGVAWIWFGWINQLFFPS